MLKFCVNVRKKTKFCSSIQTQKIQVQNKNVVIVTELHNPIVKNVLWDFIAMKDNIKIPVQQPCCTCRDTDAEDVESDARFYPHNRCRLR